MQRTSRLKFELYIILFLLSSVGLLAQIPNTGVFTGCGADALHQNNAATLSGQHGLDSLAYQHFLTSSHSQNSTFAIANIPVVVHIIHTNGPENISDAQVQAAIAHFNAIFLPSNNYQIQFCLAQQDPQGNFTTGITRDVSPLTTETMEVDDIALKNINRWPPTCYLNIWVVQEILSVSMGSAVVGYAYFPSAAGQNMDGIVIEAGFFGTSAQDDAIGAHEIGHYLGLYHTFQNGCTNNNCLADGDQVCDTPPDQTTFASCNPPSNSCSTDADDASANNPFSTDVVDLGEDYMDYSDLSCYNQFTPGQYSRMQFFLTTSRASLLNCPSCNPPCPNPITATITSPASGTIITTGGTVNFTGTTNSTGSLQWYIDPANIISTTTTAVYTFTTAGSYWVKFVALTNNPFNCLNGMDSVQIIVTEPVVTNCGGSMQFDDAHPAADLPPSNEYYSGTNGGYTWECWFRRNQPFPGTEAHPIIGALDLILFEDQYLGFGWDGGYFNEPNTKLVFRVDGPFSTIPSASSCAYSPPGGFAIGTWYHAAGVMNYNTQTAKLFVNGQLVDSRTITTAPITDVLAAQLSFDPVWTTEVRPLYSNLDEVRIWNVPKSDAEIMTNYSTCMSGNEPNLLLYYRCNQSAGSVIIDASPNSMDGVFNSPLWSPDEPPLTGASCVASCIEICGNNIDDNNNGEIDEGCACPVVSAGNDTSVCNGNSVQLNASPDFVDYSWVPAASLDDPTIANPVASPGTTTTYTLTANAPGPNLIVNPDFSAGNFGFTSNHNYSTTYTPCNYYVGPLFFVFNYNMPDHTPTSDNMYMSLDGCVNGPTMIWEQTISSVETATNYSFSFWATRADVAEPIFEIHFIGNVTGDVVLSTTPGVPYPGGGLTYWDEYGVPLWNSGANTSVTIRIINLETDGGGVDFGLDDFHFGKLCPVSDTVQVTVSNDAPPPLDLGDDIYMCTSGTHTFNAGSHLTYLWQDGSIDQTFTAYQPGIYWVTVTDTCGGFQRDTVQVLSSPPPTLTLSNDTVLCMTGNVPLTYTSDSVLTHFLWSPAVGLSCTNCANPIASPLINTTYYLVASTAGGCTNMDSVTITFTSSLPTAVVSTFPCDSSGAISIGTVSGGAFPYQYNFNNLGFSSTTVYPGFNAGIYPLTIKDVNGCLFDTLVQTPGYIYTPTLLLPNDTILCAAGSLPLNYTSNGTFTNWAWSPSAGLSCTNCNNPTATVTGTATYNLLATTADGCINTDNITVFISSSLPTSIAASFPCDSIGTIILGTVSGGFSPYQYNFNNLGFSALTTYTGLTAGTYPLTIKDDKGCSFDTSIYSPGFLFPPGSVSYHTTNIACNLPGALTLQTVTGGIPPYLFNFNNQGFSTDTVYTGLNANTYTVTVKDSAGCMLDIPITIGTDFAPVYQVDIFTAPFNCDSGGAVSIKAVYGGTAPYLFSLNNASYTSATHYNELSTGIYSIRVKDNNNCLYDTSFTISEYFDIEAIYIPNCFTPNTDLNNPTWSIKGSCVKSINCIIYNRWGEKIAELKNLDDSWDGTYKNQYVEEGVYMYVADIDYYSDHSERKSGSISVLR
ncbi:MAG: hypothetical protein K0S33_2457 [Bacteroidetes bacterium]|jgi:gliding motility-associated-like protein|nr:hypothetical protein [Bacteroidota bacterium]